MIWAFVAIFPLILAGLLCFPGLRGRVCRYGLWLAALPALILSLAPHLFGPLSEPAVLPALLLETTLGFGAHGRLFLALTALIWTAAGMYAGSSFAPHDPGRTRFALFFLLTLCGNLGLCVAQDLVSFYCFFALMSFAAYGLVIHDGTEKALRAGRIYLTMTVIGEVLLASAFFYAGLAGPAGGNLLFAEIAPILPAHAHGPLILNLAFAGFGIKAGVLFLHLWLPLAHPAAPIPASAVLSGAMIKAGLLGWLQFFAPDLHSGIPADYAAWGTALAWLGLAAAFYGAAAGLIRRDPKTMLAFSSVSQMGMMTMALGFSLVSGGTASEAVVHGLLLFALVHGTAKGALFLGVGLARTTARKTAQGRLILAGLGFAALILAGLPLTAGSVIKEALKHGALLQPGPWNGFFAAALSMTAAATTLLLAVCIGRIRRDMQGSGRRADPGMTAAWAALLGTLALAVPLAGWVLPPASFSVPIDATSVLGGLWPIGLGLAAAGLFLRSGWANRDCKGPDDLILESLEKALLKLHQSWRASRYCDPACGRIDLVAITDRLLQSRWMRTVPDRLELRLQHWHTAGILFIFLLMAFIFLAWGGRL